MQRYGPLIMAMFAMVLFLGSAENIAASNLVTSGSTISTTNTYVPAEMGDTGVSVEPTEMHATLRAFYGNTTGATVLNNYEENLGAGVDVHRLLN